MRANLNKLQRKSTRIHHWVSGDGSHVEWIMWTWTLVAWDSIENSYTFARLRWEQNYTIKMCHGMSCVTRNSFSPNGFSRSKWNTIDRESYLFSVSLLSTWFNLYNSPLHARILSSRFHDYSNKISKHGRVDEPLQVITMPYLTPYWVVKFK